MIRTIIAASVAIMAVASVHAQEAPQFLKDITPPSDISASWEEMRAIMNPKGDLDSKTKELIGLGVAAQIPCVYCIYAHTVGAKAAGATDAQIKEAIAVSAFVRKMSTELNGSSYDMASFKKQVDTLYGKPSQ